MKKFKIHRFFLIQKPIKFYDSFIAIKISLFLTTDCLFFDSKFITNPNISKISDEIDYKFQRVQMKTFIDIHNTFNVKLHSKRLFFPRTIFNTQSIHPQSINHFTLDKTSIKQTASSPFRISILPPSRASLRQRRDNLLTFTSFPASGRLHIYFFQRSRPTESASIKDRGRLRIRYVE